jgi:hypothetical protein
MDEDGAQSAPSVNRTRTKEKKRVTRLTEESV